MLVKEAPADPRDIRPENWHTRCVCGVRWYQHQDGWDGSRLSCEEALRRNPRATPSVNDAVDQFAPVFSALMFHVNRAQSVDEALTIHRRAELLLGLCQDVSMAALKKSGELS